MPDSPASRWRPGRLGADARGADYAGRRPDIAISPISLRRSTTAAEHEAATRLVVSASPVRIPSRARARAPRAPGGAQSSPCSSMFDPGRLGCDGAETGSDARSESRRSAPRRRRCGADHAERHETRTLRPEPGRARSVRIVPWRPYRASWSGDGRDPPLGRAHRRGRHGGRRSRGHAARPPLGPGRKLLRTATGRPGCSASSRPASRCCSASSSSSRSRASTPSRTGAEAEAQIVAQQVETAQLLPVAARSRSRASSSATRGT